MFRLNEYVGIDPSIVGETIYKAITDEKPNLRYQASYVCTA